MSEMETASSRREDRFLSSRGIDQSTVVMVGASLVVAFLLLSLVGRETTTVRPAADASSAVPLSETNAAGADIAGVAGDPGISN